jgi:hypothetical protein
MKIICFYKLICDQEPSQSPFSSLNQGSVCDLTLYSSPSLPNISLGRPHVPNTTASAAVVSVSFLKLTIELFVS